MPLHDWTDRFGWEGMHIFWMTEIARALRAELPPGYRAVIGASPLVVVGEVAVATLEEDACVQVEKAGRLVAVVELISPRNKDRPSGRDQYAARYLGYLRGGVHLLQVDVHRRPLEFSFPQLIATGLGEVLPAPPAPSAVSYRVGAAAATGGRLLAVWQHPLTIGAPLPTMPLPLTLDDSATIDLEGTYSRAAADSYVS
jgi:hypothetical protein